MSKRMAFFAGMAAVLLSPIQDVCADDYSYTGDAQGITITGYTGAGGDLVVPGQIDGLPVKAIGDNAFANCTSLTGLSLPEGLTCIGFCAFYGCTSLADVVLPDGLLEIGAYAFTGCAGMTSLSLPDGLADIGDFAFWGCAALTGLSLPAGVTNVGECAFAYCTSLACVTLPEGVARVGCGAFRGCAALEGVSLPGSAADVGYYAFDGCTSLRDAAVGAGVTNLGYQAFWDCPLTNVAMRGVPATVLDWNGADRVFLGQVFNASGYAVSVAPGVTGIRADAFTGCAGMTSLSLPDGLADIGGAAFWGCAALTGLSLPAGVTNVGEYAFAYCTGLNRVVIPSSVTVIAADAFVGCSGLEAFWVATDNACYSSLDGVLFNKSQTTLLLCPAQKTGILSVPSSVTAIADYAFDSGSLLSGLYFRGVMPGASENALANASQLVIYYAGQAGGWGSSLGGCPAVLWSPTAQAGSTFGVVDGKFGFDIVNDGSPVVIVEACDSVSGGEWIPVATNTLTGGSARFEDSDWTRHTSRFYRFAMP